MNDENVASNLRKAGMIHMEVTPKGHALLPSSPARQVEGTFVPCTDEVYRSPGPKRILCFIQNEEQVIIGTIKRIGLMLRIFESDTADEIDVPWDDVLEIANV